MKLSKDIVPDMMYTEGRMSMVSLRPNPPVAFHSAYSISLKDESLKINGWSKVMNVCKQPIGDNMNVRKPQVEDWWISILHFGDGGVYLFYDILPKREE